MVRQQDSTFEMVWERLGEKIGAMALRDFRWDCPPTQALTGDLAYNAQSILGDQYIISALDSTNLEVCVRAHH